MKYQLSPSIELLETKSLLSHVAVGFIGPVLPSGVSSAIGSPIEPIIGVPISPGGGTPGAHGIASPTSPVGTRTAPVNSPVSSLATSLTTNQTTYTPGQVVRMTFTVTNDTGNTVSVPIGPSIDGFSVMSGGKTVWRSNSRAEPDYVVLKKLAPGQSITLTAMWTVPSSMSGTFVVHNQLDPSDSAAFHITTNPGVVPLLSHTG